MFIFISVLFITLIAYWALNLLFLHQSVDKNARYWEERKADSGELIYVAFGDSAAQGIGASDPSRGYVGIIADRYAKSTGKTIRVINLSKSGAKAKDVINTQLTEYDRLNIKPDLVTIAIGGNDSKSYTGDEFKSEIAMIVSKLPADTYISDVPDFGGPQNRRYSAVTQLFKDAINTRNDLNFVPLGEMTSRDQRFFGTYSYDFFHPNNTGYEIWADAFWKEIENAKDK